MDIPKRITTSHKGEMGKVLIVSGSYKYYGSPILCALGAEVAGSDLIILYLPEEHKNTAKNYGLNFFLNSFIHSILSLKDVGMIIDAAKHNNAMIIGPGLGNDQNTKKAVIKILSDITIPTLIDAEALFPEILNIKRSAQWILTPHHSEFTRMFNTLPTPENVQAMARKHGFTLVVKGHVDIISNGQELYLNKTGCPEMRVGGTGDVLAGIIGSFIAQKIEPYQASCSAMYHYGKAGEQLATQQWSFSSYDLAKYFPSYLSFHKEISFTGFKMTNKQ
jgi:hydroxyethylthiazole kinase-like uncharacterized protein yjeF